MKKLIAAIVIASIGAAFANPALVYDYKASIKRLDISAKYGKINGSTQVAQKYSVKSDTVYGYVTLPKCATCSGDLQSSLGIANNGYAYLTMKGNYKNVKDTDYYVIKTPVKASIGVFGAEQTMDGKIVDDGKNTKSWMSLDFPLSVPQFGTAKLVAKKDVEATVPLAFFGLTNSGENAARVDVQNTGFGTAKVNKSSVFDFCEGETTTSCLTLQSISGTLVGYPKYQGACEHQPLWDLCKVNERTKQRVEINDSVICGSWSLKYNKSLTDAYAQEKEAAILKKFKVSSLKYQLDASGNFTTYIPEK